MSDDSRRPRKRLRLIRGGKFQEHRLGRVGVVVATHDRSPFPVDAVAVEDDTYAVLGADPLVREVKEHPIRVWTALHETEPVAPGSVTVKHERPLKLLAVVHDLSRDPTWKEAWVNAAVREILEVAASHGVHNLGLPVLGTVHGKLRPSRFVAMLQEALEKLPPGSLERVWIVARPDQLDSVEHLVEKAASPPPEDKRT